MRIQRISHRENHIFGARYYRSVLGSGIALAYAYKYLYRNPVRAGLVSRVEEYPYSTLVDLGSGIPISEGIDNYWEFIPRSIDERLSWLNVPTPKEVEELVRKALRRSKFRFTTQSTFQKPLRKLKLDYGIEPLSEDPILFGTEK
jgi:hypothetical protein